VATKAEVIDLVVDPTRKRVCCVTGRRGCTVRDPSVSVCTTRSELTTATADPTRRIWSKADRTCRSNPAQSTDEAARAEPASGMAAAPPRPAAASPCSTLRRGSPAFFCVELGSWSDVASSADMRWSLPVEGGSPAL